MFVFLIYEEVPVEAERIENEEQLERELSRPHPETVEQLRSIEGDFLVLGAGGKMGPTLCTLLKNACAAGGGQRRIYGVSRFSDRKARARLESAGVQTIQADLIDRTAYAALPDAASIFFLAGMKFGASAQDHLTWAMNTYVPALLSDSSRCQQLFGLPTVTLDTMLSLVVDWVRRGERTLNKPTKYQVRDGRF